VAADEIQSHTKLLIANLDERSQPGTHWVCRYNGVWHDPLGSNGTGQRKGFERRVQGSWTEDDPEQRRDEDNCGQRCLAALMVGVQLGDEGFALL